jgi:DsbC/DsbD-like thiol-disulfide interchange protein
MKNMQHTHSAWSVRAALLGAGFLANASAQTAAHTVQWKAAFAAARDGDVVLELSGEIQEGWHVYALTQPSGGPAALRVTLDENEIAQAAGTPSGPTPRKHRDPSFKLETQFYTHSFTVRLPVSLKKQQPTGQQLVPVSVRFQSCSDRECLPPSTAHLSVPVGVTPSGA